VADELDMVIKEVKSAMRVLVTGHHGYIGAVLTPFLAELGHDVVGLDSFYFRGCDFGDPNEWPNAIVGDLRDVRPEDLAGFDAVVHLGALSNDPLGDVDPAWTYGINRDGAVNLAHAAKEAGVGRFVFACSCSMYGAVDGDDLVDEGCPLRPITPYAESKVRAEEVILGLADASFASVSMRNATAYGASPRLRLDIVLNNLVAWAHTTGQIRLLSDGLSWRPLVHIRDISKVTAALLAADPATVSGEAFNIGTTEQNYRIRDLAETVRQRLPHCQVSYAKGASPDPRSYRVDFAKLASRFPHCRLEWTAALGADELATAYEREGLALADLEGGDRYIRLNRLKRLLQAGELGADLHWAADETPTPA
jgi:nucleoside-diphosphate-sugar epimerase